jgi:hypothetical protein
MRRTTIGDLAVPFIILGFATYVLVRNSYESLPALRYFTALPLAALAGVEFVLARRAAAAIGHRPGARLMSALSIARCAALGKASALVGAGMVGVALGLVVRLLPDAGRVTAASHDVRVGIVVGVAALLLGAAGLYLERATVDPNADRRE